MRTIYPYHGGKSRLLNELLLHVPEHEVYVEPFFGAGALFFGLPKSTRRTAVVNDLNRDVTNFLRILRTRFDDLEHACALTPHARDEFYAPAPPDGDDLERARRFWVQINQSFTPTTQSNTGWSREAGRHTPIPDSIRHRLGRFSEAAERLMAATIENMPAVELLDKLKLGPSAFVYCDPPYMPDTRVDQNAYVHEMTVDDHEALAVALRRHAAADATIIVSGYPTPEYDRWYTGWHQKQMTVDGWVSNSTDRTSNVRVECLWSNRPLNVQPSLFG